MIHFLSSFVFSLIIIFSYPTCYANTPSHQRSIVFLGDSLTEGYGVDQSATYTQIVQDRALKENKPWKIINSGISGSTSASAVARIKWLLKGVNKPDLVVIILGANDGLRGNKVHSIKENLIRAVQLLKKEKVPTILGEVWMPPNYGKDYSTKFKKIFSEISVSEKVELMPFILKNIAGDPKLNLADGIHPNEKGHKIIAETVYKFLNNYLK